MAIRNVRVILGRAELLARGALRECYDIVLSRALGKLPVALELAAPFVKVGGVLIVPHGTSWESELLESTNALQSLQLDNPDVCPYEIEQVKYVALLLKKSENTPLQYPRPTGVPSKKPL